VPFTLNKAAVSRLSVGHHRTALHANAGDHAEEACPCRG
jgi:hypothetical protein